MSYAIPKKCRVCGADFMTYVQLVTHYESDHGIEKLFKPGSDRYSMTLEDELKGVDDIYMPLIRKAKDDIVEYQEELKKYSSWKNPWHAIVRRGIRTNIETQRHFLQKITQDYFTARGGAIRNFNP